MFIVVFYCNDPDCNCLDRRGVVFGRYPSSEEACQEAMDNCPSGYLFEVALEQAGLFKVRREM